MVHALGKGLSVAQSDQHAHCLQEMKELARNKNDDIDLQPNDRDILAWMAVIKVSAG